MPIGLKINKNSMMRRRKNRRANAFLTNASLTIFKKMLRILAVLITYLFTRTCCLVCSLHSLFTFWRRSKQCPPIEDTILLHSAAYLSDKIRRKEITSELVIKTYISRIKKVNPLLNAIVEDRFAKAIEEAILVDKLIASSNLTPEELQSRYPLLGLPLTVKESIAVKGLSHNAGRVNSGRPKATTDADTVKLCRDAGAIPLLVSNTPELCMKIETSNKATGTTRNPYDTRRTAGGSSGGEAALLGAGASLLGLGSDIAGSLRIPPNFCGVWGHKPTPGMVSSKGHYPDCRDEKAWTKLFTLGPMTRYANDLPTLLDVITVPTKRGELRLNEQVDVGKIKVYYIKSDGNPITHSLNKEIYKAMKKLLSSLDKKCEMQSKEIHIEGMKDSFELMFFKLLLLKDLDNVFESDGNGSFNELFKFFTWRSDDELIPILYGTTRPFVKHISQDYITKMNQKIENIANTLEEILGDDGILIYPTFPTVAFKNNGFYAHFADIGYTTIFNVIGFPVTNCPLGLNSKGLPIGIQVVASPKNDHLTLAVAQEIEKNFGGWCPPPDNQKKSDCIK